MVEQNLPVEVHEDSEITPISREPIQKINKNGWDSCSFAELHNQLETLTARKYAALGMMRTDIANQIQLGIEQLHAHINARRQNGALK